MEREKPNFDILGRIDRERLARGWSEYTLAENSGLTQSTLSTWRRRNLQPNVTSIEKICHGLGITLSQFFEEDAAIHHLTEEQKSLLTTWDRLTMVLFIVISYAVVQVGFGKLISMRSRNSENSRTARLLTSFIVHSFRLLPAPSCKPCRSWDCPLRCAGTDFRCSCEFYGWGLHG